MEDNLQPKTNFNGRQPSLEDHLVGYSSYKHQKAYCNHNINQKPRGDQLFIGLLAATNWDFSSDSSQGIA